jgi:hypothetical protein
MQKLNRTCSLLAAFAAALLFAATPRANATDLTGTYTADDGGVYYIQQSGNLISWAGMSVDSGLSADKVWHRGLGFTNVFHGTVNADNTITGEWADVTRGATLNSGALTLMIGSSNGVIQLTTVQATGGFGATTWTQSNPLDDSTSLQSYFYLRQELHLADQHSAGVGDLCRKRTRIAEGEEHAKGRVS